MIFRARRRSTAPVGAASEGTFDDAAPNAPGTGSAAAPCRTVSRGLRDDGRRAASVGRRTSGDARAQRLVPGLGAAPGPVVRRRAGTHARALRGADLPRPLPHARRARRTGDRERSVRGAHLSSRPRRRQLPARHGDAARGRPVGARHGRARCRRGVRRRRLRPRRRRLSRHGRPRGRAPLSAPRGDGPGRARPPEDASGDRGAPRTDTAADAPAGGLQPGRPRDGRAATRARGERGGPIADGGRRRLCPLRPGAAGLPERPRRSLEGPRCLSRAPRPRLQRCAGRSAGNGPATALGRRGPRHPRRRLRRGHAAAGSAGAVHGGVPRALGRGCGALVPTGAPPALDAHGRAVRTVAGLWRQCRRHRAVGGRARRRRGDARRRWQRALPGSRPPRTRRRRAGGGATDPCLVRRTHTPRAGTATRRRAENDARSRSAITRARAQQESLP